MALYQLNEVQVKNLFAILGNTVVKYNEAAAVSEILVSLQNPVNPDIKTDNIVPLTTPKKGAKNG